MNERLRENQSSHKHPSEREDGSFVYFIGAFGGPIKIGRSANPRARLSQLQVASHQKLHLLAVTHGGAELEASMHLRFAHQRIRGEIFAASPELLMLIWELARDPDQPAVHANDSPVARFLFECTVRDNGRRAKSSKLYQAYVLWCAQMSEQPMSQKAFSLAVRRAGYAVKKSNGIHFMGMRLKGDQW